VSFECTGNKTRYYKRWKLWLENRCEGHDTKRLRYHQNLNMRQVRTLLKEKWCMMCLVNYHILRGGARTQMRSSHAAHAAHTHIKTAAAALMELSKHFLPAACLFIIYWSAQFTRWWMRKRICAAAAINSRSIGPADEKYALAAAPRYLMFFFACTAQAAELRSVCRESVHKTPPLCWIFTADAAGHLERERGWRSALSPREERERRAIFRPRVLD
jgi:hypothetical protein